MSDTEITTQTVDAVTTESAPVTETEAPKADEPAESAPATIATENTEEQGAEPSKAVKELIAQRKRRQEAEKEAAYYRGLAEARGAIPQTQTAPAQPQVPVAANVAPTSDQFETWEEYERAKDEYLISQAEQRVYLRQQQYQQQATVVQKQTTFNEKIEAAAVSDPTILSIVEDRTLPLHKHALPILYESDVAPEILKALNADRKEATRIRELFERNPILGAREFGKLEASIIAAPKPTPPKKVSLAPEPIKTVTPSGASVPDEDKLPMEQWVKRRNEKQYKRA